MAKKGKQGDGGGKPLKWKSADELEQLIEDYFNTCDKDEKPYTITGLCLVLDISRQTLMNYEDCFEIDWLKRLDDKEKRGYVDTIKRAKMRCENYAEIQLLDPNCKKSPIGSIFALKNYGWQDKQVVETTNNNINVSLEDE
jgi:hypothetical protein